MQVRLFGPPGVLGIVPGGRTTPRRRPPCPSTPLRPHDPPTLRESTSRHVIFTMFGSRRRVGAAEADIASSPLSSLSSSAVNLVAVARAASAHEGAVLDVAAFFVDRSSGGGRAWMTTAAGMDGKVSAWRAADSRTSSSSSSSSSSSEGVTGASGSWTLRRVGTWAPDDGPWWALHVDGHAAAGASDVAVRVPARRLYAGTHARTVTVRDLRGTPGDGGRWMAPMEGSVENHTGWVRALAAVRKTPGEMDGWEKDSDEKRHEQGNPGGGSMWRFSAACNYVRVWDDQFEEDEEGGCVRDVLSVKIFTGDILALAAGSLPEDGDRSQSAGERQPLRRLFCGVADGTVRGWDVAQADSPLAASRAPDLTPLPSAVSAHDARVAALVLRPPWLISGCLGGTLHVHDAVDLSAPGAAAREGRDGPNTCGTAAHEGAVRALCVGPGGLVYSGGDDGWIRAWRLDEASGRLAPAGQWRNPSEKPRGAEGEDDGREGELGRGGKSAGVRALCALFAADRDEECVGMVAGDGGGGLTLWMT